MLTQAPGRYSPLIRIVLRAAAVLLAALTILIISALVVIRVWVWPSVPQWRGDLLASAQSAAAQQELLLEAGELTADWEHWYRPRLRLDNVRLLRADGQSVGTVDRVEATLGLSSLASLWHGQPIFSEIRLANPFALIERSASGALKVAGVVVGSGAANPGQVNAVFRQGRWRVDGGRVQWRDQLRGQSIDLTDVVFAMNNFGHRHAWALRGTPPAALGEGFVLQGDFRHAWFSDPSAFQEWRGEAFVQFDRVDLSELFRVVHLPEQAPLKVNSGQGALRAWVQLHANALEDLTVDLDLTDASLQWGPTRRPLTLQQLQGRVQTRLTAQRQEVALSALTLRSAQLSEVTTIASAQMVLEKAGDSGLSAQITSKNLDLVAAMWLAEHLPLPAQWKSTLTELKPRGRLRDLELKWQESEDALTAFRVQTAFDELALAPGKQRPGFRNLSGKFSARDDGGELTLKSTGASLSFPGVFAQDTVQADRLEAQVSWTATRLLSSPYRDDPPADINASVRRLVFENADVAFEVNGAYRWPGKGAGVAALDGSVLRAEPASIHRYVPLDVGQETRTWLRESLLPSKAYTARFELHGPLDQFPFRNDSASRFVVRAQAAEARLRPAPGWPIISNIRADVEFNKQTFRISAKGARLNDMEFSDIEGNINDLESNRPILVLNGGLSGDVQTLIDATNQSPLRRTLREATSEMKGKGQANLSLALALDLDNTDRSLVDGKFSLSRGVIRLSDAMPEATVASADVGFHQNGIRTLSVQGQALGGAFRATSKTPASASGLVVEMEGQATAAGLELWAEQALGVSLDRLFTGATRYSATVESNAGVTRATVRSSLEGLGSDFFGPLKKQARENWGLRVDVQQAASNGGQSAGEQSWTITTASQALSAKISRAASGRRETLIELDAPRMAGQMKWIPARAQNAARTKAASVTRPASAVLQARLQRLWLDRSADGQNSGQAESSDHIAQDWPTVDLSVDDFRVGERAWGKLEVQAAPVAATRSWEILRFAMTSPEAQLTGQGQWAMMGPAGRGPKRSRTALDLELQVKNGGALLARSGYPKVVRDTSGKIDGRLNWPGSPLDFAGANLSGNLSLNLEQGQFLKAEPGIARLVGVLNLQSLPRRIKLDFRDVFSEGFTYERIRGNLEFNNGQASTTNLRIIGVQASVLLEGSANVRAETQDLRVLVLPEVNAGLASLGYAALVNPAVGLGAFIAQYILRNPVRELLSYEYHVTGSWDDPKVESVKREMRSDGPELSPSEKQ